MCKHTSFPVCCCTSCVMTQASTYACCPSALQVCGAARRHQAAVGGAAQQEQADVAREARQPGGWGTGELLVLSRSRVCGGEGAGQLITAGGRVADRQTPSWYCVHSFVLCNDPGSTPHSQTWHIPWIVCHAHRHLHTLCHTPPSTHPTTHA